MIKILTVSDWEDISKEILKVNKHTVAQTKFAISQEEYLKYTYKLLTHPLNTMYGFYKDDILTSYICATEYPGFQEYVVNNWKSLKPQGAFDPRKNGWGELFTRMLSDMEAKGKYSFFLVKTTDVKRLQFHRIQRLYDEAAPNLLRYERTIEEIVPAGKSSRWEYYRRALYYENVYDYETMVLRFTCKQKYRDIKNKELQEAILY